MASSIGAQSFISLTPPVVPARRQVADISDPFEDGVCYQRLSRRGPASQHTAVADCPSMAVAVGLISSYAALVGTIVTVTQYGASFPNYLVLEAAVESIEEGAIGVGGLVNGKVLVTSRWVLQYVGTS